MVFDYSHHFDNEIKLFLTQVNSYWDKDYPDSRKQKIKTFLKLDNKTIITPKQIHGDSVIRVSENSNSSECDAIIFKANSSIVGTINVADCIPICIYDFENKNIALVHSGWIEYSGENSPDILIPRYLLLQ